MENQKEVSISKNSETLKHVTDNIWLTILLLPN